MEELLKIRVAGYGYAPGLAVGLAAKEVVSNMFGGASLFVSRPFIIGEKIKVGNIVLAVFHSHKVHAYTSILINLVDEPWTPDIWLGVHPKMDTNLKAHVE